ATSCAKLFGAGKLLRELCPESERVALQVRADAEAKGKRGRIAQVGEKRGSSRQLKAIAIRRRSSRWLVARSPFFGGVLLCGGFALGFWRRFDRFRRHALRLGCDGSHFFAEGSTRIQRDADRERQRRHEFITVLGLFAQFTRTDDDPVFIHQPHLRAKFVFDIDDFNANGLSRRVKERVVAEALADLSLQCISVRTYCRPRTPCVLESGGVSRCGADAAGRKKTGR